jgi:hypothetical protein
MSKTGTPADNIPKEKREGGYHSHGGGLPKGS